MSTHQTARTTAVAGSAATLLVVLAAAFMDLLDATIVTVSAPSIGADLGATSAQLQWLVGAYVLALGSGLIVGGRLGDEHGRRRVFLLGLAGFAVTSAACGAAPSPGVLIVARALQGVAAGLMVPQVLGIIRSTFPPERLATAYGAFGATQGLAAVAGPLLGGLIVELDPLGLGWRGIFWVNVPVAVAALVAAVRLLPADTTDGQRRPLDGAGAVMVAVAMLALLVPLVQGREWGWPAWSFGTMAAGAALLAGFVAYERRLVTRDRQPVLEPALLRVGAFRAALGGSLVVFATVGSFFFTLSLYLQAGTQRSALETGLLLLPFALGSIATSGMSVALAAKAGRVLLVTGAGLLALSHALLWLVVRGGGDPSAWGIAGALTVGGLGLGLVAPILVNVALAGVEGRSAASASAVLTTAVQLGGAAGIAGIATLFFARLDAGAGFADAFAVVLVAEAVLCVVGALLLARLPRVAA